MTPFGYNMGWLAIHNAGNTALINALNLTEIKETSWDEGIDTIYSDGKHDTVFVTPVDIDWTFVIGLWAIGTGEEDSVHNIERLITKLSAQFEEVQAFATYHVIEYHHWMLAKQGHLVRAFAYLGERAEVLTNEGELTRAEQSFKWDHLEECLWTPDEETVLEISGAWSINPSDLEAIMVLSEEPGILAHVPAI